jgi:hypothetical protein
VKKGGANVPLRFDSIDYINCDGVKTHPSIISDGTDIGFNFCVREYTYFTDEYLIGDRKEVQVKKLPHWYGEGWYEKAVNDKVFTNSDNGSLGHRNKVTLRIGTDYVLTDELLDNADE